MVTSPDLFEFKNIFACIYFNIQGVIVSCISQDTRLQSISILFIWQKLPKYTPAEVAAEVLGCLQGSNACVILSTGLAF